MTAEDVQFRRIGQQAVVTMPAEIDAVKRRHGPPGTARRRPATTRRYLIIDMSRTTFCDSAGVQVIIDTYNQAAAAGTRLRLVATAVVRILTLVGVDQLMPIYPTLEAALADGPG